MEEVSPWTGNRPVGATLSIPVKHHDGAWFVPDGQLDAAGRPRPGAAALHGGRERRDGRVACVTNEAGNVCGLMPHPEHAVDALLGPIDGRPLLEQLLAA